MEIVRVTRKDGTEEDVIVLDPREMMEQIRAESCPPVHLSAKGKGHEKIAYLADFATFDIESTTMPGRKHKKLVKHKNGTQTLETVWDAEPWAFMYHWQACICGTCVFGRRWEEFFELLDVIAEEWKLKEIKRFVIYVHNLGFELTFLYPFLFEKYGKDAVKIFAVKEHQPVYVVLPNGIEIRCSWKLSNMNLYMLTHTEKGAYEKAWGDLNYKKVRTAESELTMQEKGYCLLDVLALYHAIASKMHGDHDTLASIPITSTGYPRRECRKACRKWPNYRRDYFNPCKLTLEIYELLEELRRGGNTHADRHQAARILYDLESYDYVSEYPGAMELYDFPMGQFSRYGKPESMEEFERVMASGKAVIARITLVAPKLKDDVPVPYIPIDKIWRKSGKIKGDNGRVLESEGYISLTICEIDWAIIKKQYDLSAGMICEGLWIAPKGKLPEPIINTVNKFFALKCELKEEIKKAEDLLEANPESVQLIQQLNDLNYRQGKTKNMLNGIFGMIYTDPVHLETLLADNGDWKEELPIDPKTGEALTKAALLEKYNNSRNSFLCYAWGPWVTAYGRMMLDQLQECAIDPQSGRHVCAYSDTDSAKSACWDQEKLKALIDKQQALARERGAVYVSKSGKEYLMGYPELDGHYTRFVTMGAKKYAYEDKKDGLLHVTVSGVSNTHAPGDKLGAGARELMEHGGLEAFRIGFKFKDAGGQTVWYGHREPGVITVKGVQMLSASYVAVTDGEYTLGQTEEYKRLLGSL